MFKTALIVAARKRKTQTSEKLRARCRRGIEQCGERRVAPCRNVGGEGCTTRRRC